MCEETHGRTRPQGERPQGERPGRTARARTAPCVWGDKCVWGYTSADTAPKSNGQGERPRRTAPGRTAPCVWGETCVWVDTSADTAPWRTATANGSTANRSMRVEKYMCVWDNTLVNTAPRQTARANGQGERLEGERLHVCGETHVWGDTHGRTRPLGARPGRTARANGSRANNPTCVGRHMCVGRLTRADTAPRRTAMANGQGEWLQVERPHV